ncbi:MAG: TauD/TfdA family dioxygenase [Alphaproteobacteria bacterium]|nr:TauD/TfdA family dioxygenase [Alphaproteobacteria bacterium]
MRSTLFASEVLSPAIGLEITGIDLSQRPDGALIDELRAAFLRHHVLVIRDQSLTPAQQLAFAEQMGEPAIYPFVAGLEGFPMITPVIKEATETVNFGGLWHSDTAYLERPPKATMLLARQLPPSGGDTLFASQVAAYEALSEGMKALLAPLRGVNASAKADVTRTREDRIDKAGDGAKKSFTARHPVIRTHPETGAKALYVNRGHTIGFDGLTEAESAPLLEFLYAHQVRDEFVCRVRWTPGTLVLWDNRACQHYPVNDYHGHRREMHRITLEGDVPL